MSTPLLKKLNKSGGTSYIFPSGDNQMNSTLGNVHDIKFSKFALLNLPPIKTPSNNNNNIQLSTIDGQIYHSTALTDNSTTFIESLQNYCMNFESNILNNDYNNSLDTVSERVFFKWLKELGGIRFQYASANEANNVERFVEETNINGNYNRVVEYLGEIQVTNLHTSHGNTYREVFLNVPTTVGATPTVLFNTFSDSNYYPSMTITGDNEYILGRNIYSTHPYNLSTNSFYDYDDNISYTGNNELWMGQNVTQNSFYTQPNIFNNPTNTTITKNLSDYGLLGSTTYLRSQLDGIEIEWDANLYKQVYSNNGIDSIHELNINSNHTQFDFNTILLYYDITDSNGNVSTNLYSVIFIDNMIHTLTDGSYIPAFTKNKFDNVTKLNGNSFGIKLNTKLGSVNSNEVVTVQVINDYETYSLSLYTDALSEMRYLGQQFFDSHQKVLELRNKFEVLSNTYVSKNEYQTLLTKMNVLTESFTNANMIVSDLQSVFDSIDNLSKTIDDMLNSNTPLELNIKYDILQQGTGINLNHTNSRLEISNSIQKYNNVIELQLDSSEDNINNVIVANYTNLISVTLTGTVSNNINVYLDDSKIQWKKHQTIIIYCNSDIIMNGYMLRIFTDSTNKLLKQNTYNNLLGIYSDKKIGDKIELICTDEFKQKFISI